MGHLEIVSMYDRIQLPNKKKDALIADFSIALSIICKLEVYVLKRDKWL